MKKMAIILIVFVIIYIGLLSGCTEQGEMQDIKNKFIGKWFEEGKDDKYIHFFANGVVKDNEQNGTWDIVEYRLIMSLPLPDSNQILYPLKFIYKFSNDNTRLTLSLVEKTHVQWHYTKEI
jgi:hypothetical protein